MSFVGGVRWAGGHGPTFCFNIPCFLDSAQNNGEVVKPLDLFIHSFVNVTTAHCWVLNAFSVLYSYMQSIELLWRGISLSEGRYVHTEEHKRRIVT
jgi:hypothetical protein